MCRSPFPPFASFVVLICLNCGVASELTADEGHPVAIRFWPERAVTVETMWNLHIGLRNNYPKDCLPRIPDLELRMEKEPIGDTAYPELLHVWSGSTGHEYVLDRKPNQEKPVWTLAESSEVRSTNSVLVWQIPVELATTDGNQAFVSMIAVDGVRIVDAGGATAEAFLAAMKASPAQMEKLPQPDAILLTEQNANAESLLAIAELLKPRMIIIPLASEVDAVGVAKIRRVTNNTLAISASKDRQSSATEFVSLGDVPFQMSEEMAGLYAQKEVACKRSREVFSRLSVEQMNFVPGDGSHTPRWNAEHMMGRELGFWSQIYHNIDPAMPVMDLNPKQMPDQYKAAHSDWTGAEEARQMHRVESFNRRFAYLLDGTDLEGRVQGNPFRSLRALLVQMDRHYTEHTGNVEKKMKLPNWPTK